MSEEKGGSRSQPVKLEITVLEVLTVKRLYLAGSFIWRFWGINKNQTTKYDFKDTQ